MSSQRLSVFAATALIYALLCAGILPIPAFAENGDANKAAAPMNFQPSPEARELVRRIVANELKQEQLDRSHYMFKLERMNPKGSKLQEIIETDQGNVARTLLVNGQKPDVNQQAAEAQKIQRLLTDQDEQRKRLKQEKDDTDRAQLMIRALPNAFFYQEIGREGDIVKLRFRPDPNYEPGSREESVYTGMAGELWLNLPQERLRKIDAHLFHDVEFGWGILGKLYKGGSFSVEQEQVDGNHWDTTRMTLDLTGKALFFKSLIYKEKEIETDFKRVPDHITLAQGVEMLKKDSPELAQKNGE
jgi:hypothetical protein